MPRITVKQHPKVTEKVDAKVREQIKAGVWPIRLKSEEWTGGDIHWLLDVIAPNQEVTQQLVAALASKIEGMDMRLHPGIARLVDQDVLKKMGAARQAGEL